jgi:hypothetical protein
MRSRIATIFTILGLAAGTGGAIAIANSDQGRANGGAAEGEYKPGKGCGDENHKHERSDECKKHHEGDEGGGGDEGGDNGDHHGDNGGGDSGKKGH